MMSIWFGVAVAFASLQVIVPVIAYFLERGQQDERFEGDKLSYRS